MNAAHLEAIMLRPFETELELETAASSVEAVVIGPAAGITEATLSNVLALARTGAALVVDADALTVFRDDPDELFQALDRDDVLTPHAGEFERVFPGLLSAAPERVTAARQAAARAQCVVLLKGPDTVIAAADGRAAVNLNGTPWLATAGSGDVLAGLIGGLIAQGMESFEAACAGAWIHAACADDFGVGLISEDLPGLVPSVLKRLRARSRLNARRRAWGRKSCSPSRSASCRDLRRAGRGGSGPADAGAVELFGGWDLADFTPPPCRAGGVASRPIPEESFDDVDKRPPSPCGQRGPSVPFDEPPWPSSSCFQHPSRDDEPPRPQPCVEHPSHRSGPSPDEQSRPPSPPFDVPPPGAGLPSHLDTSWERSAGCQGPSREHGGCGRFDATARTALSAGYDPRPVDRTLPLISRLGGVTAW